MSNVTLREFIFQKCYGEEMIKCLHNYRCLICFACQGVDDEHTCNKTMLIDNWEYAKHYIDLDDLLHSINVRCIKYGIDEMTQCELGILLQRSDKNWKAIVQAIVAILDL